MMTAEYFLRERFKQACKKNDKSTIKELLCSDSDTTNNAESTKFDVNAAITKHQTPVHFAIDHMDGDDTDILVMLIDAGANYKSPGSFYFKCSLHPLNRCTPLGHAIAQHRIGAIKLLMAKSELSFLQASIASRGIIIKLVGQTLNMDIISLFLDRDEITMEDRTQMFYAALSPKPWIMDRMKLDDFTTMSTICHMTNFDPFEISSRVYTVENHLAVLRYILDRGVSDYVYKVPHFPRRGDPRKVFELLLSRGWDIRSTDFQGYTVLHLCTHYQAEPDLLEFLVNNEADIMAKADDGSLPLHTILPRYQDFHSELNTLPPAKEFCQQKAIKLLQFMIDKGVDVNSRRPRGFTVLNLGNSGWLSTFIDVLMEDKCRKCPDILIYALKNTSIMLPQRYVFQRTAEGPMRSRVFLVLIQAGLTHDSDIKYEMHCAIAHQDIQMLEVAAKACPVVAHRLALRDDFPQVNLDSKVGALATQFSRYPFSLQDWCICSIRSQLLLSNGRKSIFTYSPRLPIPKDFIPMITVDDITT